MYFIMYFGGAPGMLHHLGNGQDLRRRRHLRKRRHLGRQRRTAKNNGVLDVVHRPRRQLAQKILTKKRIGFVRCHARDDVFDHLIADAQFV